ncbi:MAG: hypothetical protein ABR924_20120 [Terracidiphilus sp.]|jgi:hypothetical protein
MDAAQLVRLRTTINENIRVQAGGARPVAYIDIGNALSDTNSRQNHVIFARRGCGKSLLLHTSAEKVDSSTKIVSINCEDFKRHSFPNVLIEILDGLLSDLEAEVHGYFWLGPKSKARKLMKRLRANLEKLRGQSDSQIADVRRSDTDETKATVSTGAQAKVAPSSLNFKSDLSSLAKTEVETKYSESRSKIEELDKWLPQLKKTLRQFFDLRPEIKSVYLHIDDFYHLLREDQPLVMDYIHRMCKGLPVFFKVATLRHVSTLYAERSGQPLGAQERNDYLPVDIDFTLENFTHTVNQNRKIFAEFERQAGLERGAIQSLFKGAGFERLVLAGGGVPRDCLSLFLTVLDRSQPPNGDGRIGKDEVRLSSRSNFERRIADLKEDCGRAEQLILIKGVYVLRQLYIDKKSNILMVSEEALQKDDQLRALLYRLMDYRIIHSAGTALTHKSQPGTYHAFAIDIGCYAHMRKLQSRFVEIDLSENTAREKMRSAPIFDISLFYALWDQAPADAEQAITTEDTAAEGEVEDTAVDDTTE